jgi:predicted TIM-barrel fold metal-dependent hydrolase
MMADTPAPVVDIHTHMYPPAYVEILESRSTIPLVRSFPGSEDPRLILLEAEVPSLGVAAVASNGANGTTTTTTTTHHVPGRPLTKHYSSLDQKIHFMDTHGIDISVISLANPWLDFLSAEESAPQAKSINQSFSDMCAQHPGRLYFFATLPLTAPLPAILASIRETSELPYCRGAILGTSGLGKGLDDPDLIPIFQALADCNMTLFLHPHYGLPNEVWGPLASSNYGHVLPLALGFPMETTIAVARMYLAGVFDAVPGLRMILAHSGGTLPFLAGRIESCVLHDGQLVRDGKVTAERRTVWDVLREQIYLDAVIYSDVGLKAAVDAAGSADRVMFGTDHPFFPPLTSDEEGKWESVTLNAEAVDKAVGQGTEAAKGIMGGNAYKVLKLSGM